MVEYNRELPNEIYHEMWDEVTRRRGKLHDTFLAEYTGIHDMEFWDMMFQKQFLLAKVAELYDKLSDSNAEILDLRKELEKYEGKVRVQNVGDSQRRY